MYFMLAGIVFQMEGYKKIIATRLVQLQITVSNSPNPNAVKMAIREAEAIESFCKKLDETPPGK